MSSNENQLNEKPEMDSAKDQVDEDVDFENDDGGLENDNADLDWDARILCDDGNCIGVVGPDGFCKECGRRYEGAEDILEEPTTDEPELTSPKENGVMESKDLKEDETCESDGDQMEGSPEADEWDLEWERRKLCSDGSCIGVIGPDGLCKECGKPYEGDV